MGQTDDAMRPPHAAKMAPRVLTYVERTYLHN
jgi:hypothetical protein